MQDWQEKYCTWVPIETTQQVFDTVHSIFQSHTIDKIKVIRKLKHSTRSKICPVSCRGDNRELKQPRRRRQQKPIKFAYLTMKNSIFCTLCACIFSSFDILKRVGTFHWPPVHGLPRMDYLNGLPKWTTLSYLPWKKKDNQSLLLLIDGPLPSPSCFFFLSLCCWSAVLQTHSFVPCDGRYLRWRVKF